MAKTSIIIPALNEPLLAKTVDDIFLKAKGEIEVVVVLDGYWADANSMPEDRDGLIVVHRGATHGMRSSINTAARIATGKYLLKTDAHCAFDPGFDKKLAADCEPDWTMVPTRYRLDADLWESKTYKKYEFQYIDMDTLKGRDWPEYSDRFKRGEKLIDLMTTQGSCWFMHRERFWELGGLDEVNYGSMGREAQEMCLKAWLSGGRLVLSRKTWYAHWNKPKEFVISDKAGKRKSVDHAIDFWKNNKWPGRKRDFSWMGEHFAPVPTWPEQRKEKEMLNKVVAKKEVAITSRGTSQFIREKYQLNGDKSPMVIKGMTRAGMYGLFAELGFKRGAEIGVQRGRNALIMMNTMPDLEMLYLIDPYEDHPYNRRKWGEKQHSKAKRMAHGRFGVDRARRIEWIEGFSEQVANQVPDMSLDFVYIDGEHTYDFVMIDIILWHRKVKKGGIVSGHDYFYHKPRQPKVSRAVRDWATAYKLEPIYLTDGNVIAHPGDRNPSWFYVNNRRHLSK